MNDIKVIVSLTSHTKERLSLVPFYLFHSIIKYQYNYVKIVLTLYKEDVQFIPPKLQEMIDLGLVELIVAEENLKCHLKYFYAMKKYRNLPIITIDDDSIYPQRMIPDLLANAEKYPNTIICRSARVIDCSKTYSKWYECNFGVEWVNWRGGYNEVRTDLNPEGYAGILYPPNILNVDDTMIPVIKEIPRADDIYLTVLEQIYGLKSILCKYDYNKLDKCTKGFAALSTARDFIGMNDDIINRYLRPVVCK